MGLTRGWFLGTPELGYGMGHRRCLRRASREHQRQKGENKRRGAGDQGKRWALRASARSVDFIPSARREATEGFSASQELGRA